MAPKLTTEQFIEKSKAVHGNKYDYSKAVYKGQSEKVTLICPIHGEFSVHPANHYAKGTSCNKCSTLSTANKQRKSLETFKLESSILHDNFYTYENAVYSTARKPITITCPMHGDFQQLPTNHLKGVGCPSCNGGMYNASKPTILYYLSINDGQAYKIGITCKTIHTRFKPEDMQKIEVLFTKEFNTGLKAYKIEQFILEHFKADKYVGNMLLQSGNTELFSSNILTGVISLCNSIDRLPHNATLDNITSVLETL